LPTLAPKHVKNVVLIVSTGRTGTKAIATHLDTAYSQVKALHEPPPTRFLLRRTANKYLCGRISRDELARVLTDQRRALVEETVEDVYVESNPGLAGFLDVFGDVFPDFQVLHVVRDPRTYVVSALNWGVFRGAKHLLARYLKYWLPKPEYMQNSSEPKWRDMSGAERLSWHWKLINQHLDRAATMYPDRYLRMKFEDLFARDGSGMAKFVESIGLPFTEQITLSANAGNVNASRGEPIRWKDWNDDDKRAVLRYCAPQMRAYGYDLSQDQHLL
jgi:hypothetical protein